MVSEDHRDNEGYTNMLGEDQRASRCTTVNEISAPTRVISSAYFLSAGANHIPSHGT